MESGKEQRVINSIGMFDFGKGVLMIAIIIGHSITEYIQYWTLSSPPLWAYPLLAIMKIFLCGAVPAFFMMSGYNFKQRPVRTCVKKTISSFSGPYLLVAVCVTLLTLLRCLLKGKGIAAALADKSVPFLLGLCPGETVVAGVSIGSIGPMWFLMALAVSGVLLCLIFYLKNEVMRVLCLAFLTAVATQLPFHSFYPFCIVQSFCCASYMYVGYCLKKEKVLGQKLSKSSMTIMICILCYGVIFGNVEVSQNVWAKGMADFIASMVAGFLFLKVFLFFNQFHGIFFSTVRKIGRNSLYVFCVHSIEYLAFPWGRAEALMGTHKFFGIVVTFLLRSLLIFIGCRLLLWAKRRQYKRKHRKGCGRA